ncbi:hypothetical protein [Zavarzinella formosa]|uniref:hypothetical protein n=1 Tax=Zavarzinella formosa TaxID=360055 RepID=UPI000318A46E|nr:hypothetical protein [Zavarzinella formosa]
MRAMLSIATLFAGISFMSAAEPTVSAKLIAKTNSYAWPVAQKPAEFDAMLKAAQQAIRDKKEAIVPKPFLVDFVLQLTNTGKEPVTIFVKGDVNTLNLELEGPGVVALAPPKAVTLEFRLAQPVKIESGKTYDIAIDQLQDGFRGMSRLIFFTSPGDYTLKATYQLADSEERKGAVLKTDLVKFRVEPPK